MQVQILINLKQTYVKRIIFLRTDNSISSKDDQLPICAKRNPMNTFMS